MLCELSVGRDSSARDRQERVVELQVATEVRQSKFTLSSRAERAARPYLPLERCHFPLRLWPEEGLASRGSGRERRRRSPEGDILESGRRVRWFLLLLERGYGTIVGLDERVERDLLDADSRGHRVKQRASVARLGARAKAPAQGQSRRGRLSVERRATVQACQGAAWSSVEKSTSRRAGFDFVAVWLCRSPYSRHGLA